MLLVVGFKRAFRLPCDVSMLANVRAFLCRNKPHIVSFILDAIL